MLKYFYANDLVASGLGLFVAVNIQLKVSQLKRVIHAMTLVVVFASLVSIIQFFYPEFLFNRTEGYQYVEAKFQNRIWSIYSWTVFVDIGFSFLSFISIIFGVGMLVSKRKYSLLFLGFLISLLNGSRWVILNSILISFQDFLGSRNRFARLLKYSIYLVGLLLLVGLSLLALGVDLKVLVFERLFQNSASTRLVALEVFLDQFPKAPILGTGGVYTEETKRLIAGRSSQIHVGFLALFYLYGIVGGLIFLSFMYTIMRKLGSVARKTGYWGSYYSFLGLFVANITLVSFEIFYHGLFLAIIFHNFFERNSHLHFKKAPARRKGLPPLPSMRRFRDFKIKKGFVQIIGELSEELLAAGLVIDEKDIQELYRQMEESEASPKINFRKHHSRVNIKAEIQLDNHLYRKLLDRESLNSALELRAKEGLAKPQKKVPGLTKAQDREVFRQWAISEQRLGEASEHSEQLDLTERFQIQQVLYDPEFFSKKVVDIASKKEKVLRLLSLEQMNDWGTRDRFVQVYEKELAYYGELSEIQESNQGYYYTRSYIKGTPLKVYMKRMGLPGKKHLYELKERDRLLISFLLKDLFNTRILHGEMNTINTLVQEPNIWTLERDAEIVLTGFTSKRIENQEMDARIVEVIVELLGEELFEEFLQKYDFF